MGVALDELALPTEHRRKLWDYLVAAADSLVNTSHPDGTGPSPGGRPNLLDR
jgi:truncated hemoglobin YjbI